MTHDKFIQALLDRSEKLDAEILKGIKLDDGWIGNVQMRSWEPEWWLIREEVRRIVEGLHFTPSPPSKSNMDSTFDRFRNVFPDLNQDWKPIKPGTVLDVMLK